MATEPATELTFGDPGLLAAEDRRDRVAGLGPWRLALRRLRRNRVALAFGGLFVLIVAICIAAPLYADQVAHTDPFKNHLTDTIVINGQTRNVVAPDGVPIGPTYHGRFFLGADGNGRDIAVRLLYGGRTSLLVGVSAALGTILLSILVGTLAGYFRGWPDTLLSRALDILWAFPPLLLGLALGTALALGGLKVGPITIPGDSLLIPILIIAIVQVPYMARAGARAAREGVRRGGAGAGRRPTADHVLRDPPEPRVDDRRVLPAHGRQRDPARGGALVPRGRGAAAEPLVGDDSRRRHPADRHGAAPDDRAGPHARAHGALAERLR
jgi:hypothetical protein